MIMKKVVMFLMAALVFAACSSDDAVTDGETKDLKSTEVYAMGKMLDGINGTRAGVSAGYAQTRGTEGANYADAYFFVRFDGRIPKSVGKYQSNEYWPYNGGSVFSTANCGLVDTNYPYWKIYSNNGITSVREYLYDSTGDAVSKIIDKVPSFKSMMSVNRKDVADIAAIDTTNLKIIWYVAKYTFGKWHVDGVLTFNHVKDVEDIPGGNYGEPSLDNKADEYPVAGLKNVEVDIHQQEHDNWQEIKTSVHIRDLVDKVMIELPLGHENIAEADDFAIRTYDLDLGAKVYINGTEYALDSTKPVKVTIEHRADKAVFTITCTDAKYLNALRKEYGDGITVEIHTYPKNLTKEEVWARLKNSKVKVSPDTYENLVFRGATSAFFTE